MRENDRFKGRKKPKNQDSHDGKTELEGIIVASEWDEYGNVTEIRIQSTLEDEYIIENRDMFMNMIQCAVRAAGKVKNHKNGSKSIYIKRCTLVGNADDGDLENAVPQTA